MQEKIDSLITHFSLMTSPEKLYQEIMRWGKKLPHFKDEWKTSSNLVEGCQSVMYLHAEIQVGKMHFSACSDALISAGLAAILIEVYQAATPEEILKTPPHFLDTIGVPSALTPGRANGLASLYLKMKQQALNQLILQK